MFMVENNNITMTKGDSGFFNVSFENGDGTEYVPKSGEEIIFTVKKKKEGFYDVVLEKSGKRIVFEKHDTEKIPSGEYVYDIMISKGSNERYTALEGKFVLRKAVHEFE
ncbi:MAG: hypothetical protein IJ316_04815 [Clostridia bacterium]|nr:hypothetical protein [Clostridia bacterium]